MENEEQTQETQPESNAAPLSIVSREGFEKHFEEKHEQDSQESEEVTEAPSVNEEQSDSSSVKEEIKGGKQKDEAVDKTAELIKNKEKALHEEREKRKQANLKLRELQKQYEDRMQEFEKRLADISVKKTSDESSEPENPDTKALQLRLKELEDRDRKLALEKQQAESVEKQSKLQEAVIQTDKALKDDGFPGFRFAVNEVDKALKQMYAEGEIDEADYYDTNMWKEVYRTKIYSEVASEFTPKQKETTLNDRMAKKKEASKVSSTAGSKPVAKEESSEEEIETDDVREYLKFRSKNSAKV